LTGTRHFVCDDLENLEAVAKEREEVAKLVKILHVRKDELEDILKTQLKSKAELVLGGVRYRMFKTTSQEYRLEPTLATLANLTGASNDDLIREVATIDKKALDSMVKRLAKQLDKSKLMLLKAELDANAEKHYGTRFSASEVA
jgi:hypothetical protein